MIIRFFFFLSHLDEHIYSANYKNPPHRMFVRSFGLCTTCALHGELVDCEGSLTAWHIVIKAEKHVNEEAIMG